MSISYIDGLLQPFAAQPPFSKEACHVGRVQDVADAEQATPCLPPQRCSPRCARYSATHACHAAPSRRLHARLKLPEMRPGDLPDVAMRND